MAPVSGSPLVLQLRLIRIISNMKKKFTLSVICCLIVTLSAFGQEYQKYELGLDATLGFSMKSHQSGHYGVDIWAGIKTSKALSVGAGINYSSSFGKTYLPSGFEYVFIQTGKYHTFTPFVLCKYVLLPSNKWNPYFEARIGYGFPGNSDFSFHVLTGYDFDADIEKQDYSYLEHLDHTLQIKGGIYAAINIGISRNMGVKDSKVSFGIRLDLQPVEFCYLNKTEHLMGITLGPYIGISL